MKGRNFSLTKPVNDSIDQQIEDWRNRYQDDLEAERASLAAIDAVSDRGRAAVERGEFRLVDDEAGRRALLEDLNRRATGRAAARKK